VVHPTLKVVSKPVDLLQGTLDLLILKAVSIGRVHGYGVLLRLQQLSDDRLHVQEGALYQGFHRLEHQGLLQSNWSVSENNRRAKYYVLTVAGRRRFQEEVRRWNDFATIVATILKK
jgi:PadR family transcriptional regulator